MGKRKAAAAVEVPASPAKKSNGLQSSIKEEKTEKRPPSSESEHEDEDDTNEEPNEAEETQIDPTQFLYEPDEMRVMVEALAEYMKDRKPVSVHQLEKCAVEWVSSLAESHIDVNVLVTDYKKYLKNAVRLKHFQVQDASIVLLRYLGSERSLGDFKSFPTKPPQKVSMYCKKNNISFRPSSIKDVYNKLHDESDEVKAEIDEELKALTSEYASSLEEFMSKHPNLTEAQKKHINDIKKRIQKQLAPKPKTAPKTPRKSAKKEQETAFSLFCRSKADKYTDLSEEAREKKLLKKFSKLSDAERDLLESLALNS